MSALEAILLGVIEGITEFLPISSTGHLILASHVLGIPSTEFVKSFQIAIQLGAIGAVLLLYWRSFLDVSILKKIIAGFIPTAVVGFTLYSFVKEYLIGNVDVVLWALFIGGILLIAFEYFHKEKPLPPEDTEHTIAHITMRQAVLVGLFQSVALIPGVSRAGATILGGLLIGIRRTAIVQFSFLLAVPTLIAAVSLDMARSAGSFSFAEFSVLGIGFVTSLIVATFSMRFLLSFIRTHSFVPFGIYRILLAALFFFLIIL